MMMYSKCGRRTAKCLRPGPRLYPDTHFFLSRAFVGPVGSELSLQACRLIDLWRGARCAERWNNADDNG